MERKTFLLADDDIDDREMFCEALQATDHDIVCHVVANGRELLNTLASVDELPRLIFLDINMPVMDGWECLKELKSDERYKDIPVIIISTSSHQREMDIAKELNATCYFTKPNDFKDLSQILHTIAHNLGPQLAVTLQNMQRSGSQYIHTLNE